jgi:hypothetical protein
MKTVFQLSLRKKFLLEVSLIQKRIAHNALESLFKSIHVNF